MDLVATPANPIPTGAISVPLRTPDGLHLRAAYWPAAPSTRRGTVAVVTGRTEFIEKYFEVIGELQARGFAVASFDWRGQGRSDRQVTTGLGHVESFADYDRDLAAFVAGVMQAHCPPPHFALAHSMGALVVLRAAATGGPSPFARMVLAAPMLALSRKSSPPMRVVRAITATRLFIGQDATSAVGGRWRQRSSVMLADDPVRHERVAGVVRAVPALSVGQPTVRWLHASAQAMHTAEAPDFARRVRTPTLVVVPGLDERAATDAMTTLADRLPVGRAVLIPGARHEMLMERDALRALFWAAFDAFIPGAAVMPAIAKSGVEPLENEVVQPGIAGGDDPSAGRG